MTQQPLPLSDPVRREVNRVCILRRQGRSLEAASLLEAVNRIRTAFGGEPITDPEAATAWSMETPPWAQKTPARPAVPDVRVGDVTVPGDWDGVTLGKPKGANNG